MPVPYDSYQVFIVDRLSLEAEVTTFEIVQAVDHDLDTGNWRVLINIDSGNSRNVVQAAMDATWLGIEIVDNETGWRYGGPATYRRRRYGNLNQVTELELRGVDYMTWLDDLLDWPDPLDYEQWWNQQTGTPLTQSTATTNQLAFNGGPAGLAARMIPDLNIVDPPTPEGPARTWRTTGLPLAEVFRPWFENSDYTYRLGVHRTPGVNELRFTPTRRAVAPMIVTPGVQGDVEIIETAASATSIIGMGGETASTGDDPDAREVWESARPQSDWTNRRVERFINRPAAADFDSIANETDAELSATARRKTITVPDFDVLGYGDLVHLGDQVQVQYDDNEPQVLAPIVTSRLTGTADGWTRIASVGADIPVAEFALDRKIGALNRRLRRLEGFVR